jgi:hypothetical protein
MKNKRGRKFFFFGRKKGQELFGMSFGMIFSIFLIIIFIIIAWIAIKHFLDISNCAKIGIFVDDLKKDVDKAWNSEKSEFDFNSNLPSSLEYVCFANLSDRITAKGIEKNIGNEIGIYKYSGANMFLYPREKACNIPYHKIPHIDIESITSKKNPYCVKIEGGKVSIKISQGFNQASVCLGDDCSEVTQKAIQ